MIHVHCWISVCIWQQAIFIAYNRNENTMYNVDPVVLRYPNHSCILATSVCLDRNMRDREAMGEGSCLTALLFCLSGRAGAKRAGPAR